jgi:hypothetical protein
MLKQVTVPSMFCVSTFDYRYVCLTAWAPFYYAPSFAASRFLENSTPATVSDIQDIYSPVFFSAFGLIKKFDVSSNCAVP